MTTTTCCFTGSSFMSRGWSPRSGGASVRAARAETEWITIEAPELRIVDEQTWSAVRELTNKRERLTMTTARGPRSRYLLSGFSRCAQCGGPIKVANGKVSHDNVKVYGCAWHKDRGSAVCSNALRRPVASVDAAVLGWIREHVLREEVIAEALREARRRLAERARTANTGAPELEAQVKKLRVEIERTGEAIVSTTEAPGALVRMMGNERSASRRQKLCLAALQTAPAVLDLEVRRMEKEARRRIEELAKVMTRNPDEARATLETLLGGPPGFGPVQAPEGKRFRIEGEIALEAVFLTEGEGTGVTRERSRCPTKGVPSGIRTELHPEKTRAVGVPLGPRVGLVAWRAE